MKCISKKLNVQDCLTVGKHGAKGNGDSMKAIVEIQRKDWKKPFIHEVYWAEAVQRTSEGSVLKFWEKMPRFQLKKVAISQGFRLCFSNEIGGISYDGSEVPYAETNPINEVQTTTAIPQSKPEQKPVETQMLSQNMSAVEVKKTFSKSVLKKALTDGVLIPGVELIQGKDTLSISATAPASAVGLQRKLVDVA